VERIPALSVAGHSSQDEAGVQETKVLLGQMRGLGSHNAIHPDSPSTRPPTPLAPAQRNHTMVVCCLMSSYGVAIVEAMKSRIR